MHDEKLEGRRETDAEKLPDKIQMESNILLF